MSLREVPGNSVIVRINFFTLPSTIVAETGSKKVNNPFSAQSNFGHFPRSIESGGVDS
jgi:hypothetical protein